MAKKTGILITVGVGYCVLDYDIVNAIKPIIINGLVSLNLQANVLLNYQPTKQGITESTVYFHNIGDKDIGFVGRHATYNQDQDNLIYKESQITETTFQVNTILKQDVENLTITAKDLCNYVKMILQSTETINKLKSSGLETLRVTNIINTPFTGGADNYQYNPSFDVVIVHTQELEYNINKIDKIDQKINEV